MTILRPGVPVVIEYDRGNQRATKRFTDAYAARRFWLAKLKAGKRPTVRKA